MDSPLVSHRQPGSGPELRRLGRLSYEDCHALQLRLVEQRNEERIPDTLIEVEHPPVITLGRKTPGVREGLGFPEQLGGIPVRLVERGGEATYHGPGQLVVYPILRLSLRFGPKAFLRMMEDAMVELLAAYGIAAYWAEGRTGVWVLDGPGRERKIASLGVAVRRSVSYHGLALNVNTDLRPFGLIQPCGFSPSVMTSMREVAGRELPFAAVSARLTEILCRRFAARDGRRG